MQHVQGGIPPQGMAGWMVNLVAGLRHLEWSISNDVSMASLREELALELSLGVGIDVW